MNKIKTLESHNWKYIHDFDYIDDFAGSLDRKDFYYKCKRCGTWAVGNKRHPEKVDNDNILKCNEIVIKDIIE